MPPDAQSAATKSATLGQTRQHLASWAPPEPEFNFRVVRGAAAPPPRRRLAFVPQWGLAAAASLLLVAGAAAIANVEVRRDAGGFVVRTGWANAATPAAALPIAPVAASPAGLDAASSEQLKAVVTSLERRLAEIEQAQTAQIARVASTVSPGISVPELRKILAESESRQRAELAVQIAQVWNDFSVARVGDFERVQQVVKQAQGMTNYQLKQHRDSIDSLYRVSASQQMK